MTGYWHRKKIVRLLVVGITAAVLLTAMVLLDRPLKTEAAPQGIVSLELAGSYEKARRILASWGESGRRNATLSLWIDYAFLIAYAVVLSWLCAGVAHNWTHSQPRIRRMGFILAGCQWIAALLDSFENSFLLHILSGSTAVYLPLAARWSALVKFTLIACGWLYILIGGSFRAVCYFRSAHDRFGN